MRANPREVAANNCTVRAHIGIYVGMTVDAELWW